MITEDGQPAIETELNTARKDINSVFKKDLIIKGSIWFALITIITIAAIFFYNNTVNAIQALTSIKPVYIIFCLFMLFIDLMPRQTH